MIRHGLAGLALLAVGTAGLVRAVEIPTHHQRARNLGCIPGEWDYRGTPQSFSATKTAHSLPGILLGTDSPGNNLRYFQLGENRLEIDHCSLSRFVVTMRENGTAAISFRADQNTVLTGDIAEPKLRPRGPARPLAVKQVEHLKRNEFNVTIRFLAASGPPETKAPSELGRVVLGEVAICPFWVRRGEPYNYHREHGIDFLPNYFSRVDRVEVQFAYR